MTIITAPTGLTPFVRMPDVSWYRRIDYRWWLQRIPMVLLALPSAYGVGAFAGEHLPPPFNIAAGAAFESAYIGAIALADQQHDETDWLSSFLWLVVNLFAVVASALSNMLFFADGSYNNITAEVATHGIPLPVLGFFYGLMMHRMSIKSASKVIADEERDRNNSVERRIETRKTMRPFICPFCSSAYEKSQALHGHAGRCATALAADPVDRKDRMGQAVIAGNEALMRA